MAGLVDFGVCPELGGENELGECPYELGE